MKRFYSMALLAACALSVAAAPLKPRALNVQKAKPAFKSLHQDMTAKLPVASLKAAVKADAPSISDITGNYLCSYVDELDGIEVSGDCVIKAGTTEGTVLVNFPLDFSAYGYGTTSVDIPATYNNGTLTFTAGISLSFDLLGMECTGDLYTMHYDWDISNYYDVESFDAHWNGAGFTFDADDLLLMSDDTGAWFGFDEITIETDPTSDPNYNPNEGWTSIGQAEFVDGWVVPVTGEDPRENAYMVEMQQNNDNKNVYRLVDPYHGNAPMAVYNECTKAGYIQFDVTDPDHVMFIPVEAGFANSQMGISKFYCTNQLASYALYFEEKGYSFTTEDLIELLEGEIPFTTYKDGVIELGSIEHPEYGTIYDACFGIQGNISAGACWQDQSGNVSDSYARITFPDGAAIYNVSADTEANAPVEYFNLLGNRISAPAAGQIVIRRQGSKATKIAF